MELLLVFVVAYAVQRAFKDTTGAYRKSKGAYMRSADARFPSMPKPRRAAFAVRHDAGYWLAQVLHAFPVTRHGFATGWHAGRKEHAERSVAREKAKAEHLEARAHLAPQEADWRDRQRTAAEQIRSFRRPRHSGKAEAGREEAGEGSFPEVPDVPESAASRPSRRVDGKPETETDRRFFDLRESGYSGPIDQDGYAPGREGAGEGGPDDDGRTWSYTSAGNPLAWPAHGEEHARSQARYWSGEGDPWLVTGYPPGGGPGTTTAAYLNGKVIQPTDDQAAAWDSEAAERKRQYQADGRLPADGTAQAQPRRDARQGGQLAITQGETMAAGTASDVTYDGVLASLTAAKDRAESTAAESAAASQQAEARANEAAGASKNAAGMADAMQGLEVDPGTLSAMVDHLDAHEAAEQAHQAVQEASVAAVKADQRVLETAGTVEATLRRGHSGLAEAHQNAPVQAATREFYAGLREPPMTTPAGTARVAEFLSRLTTGMSRKDAARWKSARTTADLGELVIAWLNGEITRTPAHCGPPDDETFPLVPALTAVNRGGFVTDNSQLAEVADGQAWNAWVCGFASDETLARIRAAAEGTPLTVEACRGRAHECHARRSFLLPCPRKASAGFWADACPDAADVLRGTWWVYVEDPEPGRNDLLWPALAAALG